MPLPAALLERLKKRGIVPSKIHDEEEVIAEDHDSESSGSESDESSKLDSNPVEKKYKAVHTVVGCPNKVNVYHDCTEFCEEKYGNGNEIPSPRTERKYRNLLKRFPLPLNWLDVWEPGTSRYYFWNTETDEVSWLPPLHPKAKITIPVSKMKETLRPENEENSDDNSSDLDSDSDNLEDSDSDGEPEPKKAAFPESRKTWDQHPFQRNRQPVKRNDLDPMDPASYSDSCPRGRWSDGLSRDKED